LGFSLQPSLLFALLAQFPYDALGAKFTVPARIRARLAVLQAFLAIADFHLLALDESLTVCVKTAIHGGVTSCAIRKFLLSEPELSIMKKLAKIGTKCNESAFPYQRAHGIKAAGTS
jgi:hypothetical protein